MLRRRGLRPRRWCVLDFTADGSTLVLKDTNPYAWNTSDWTPLAGAPAIPQNPELPRTDQKSDYSAASQRQVDVNFNQVNASSVSAGSAGRYWLSPGTADLTAVAISRDGEAVTGIRVVTDSSGTVITAYPIGVP